MRVENVALGIIAALWLAACTTIPSAHQESSSRSIPSKRTIYMSAVEYKGSTSAEKEPFPTEQPPKGGGYILKSPDAQGQWQNSTYRFEPGLIAVNQGDDVELKIWGVNGAHHHTEIEGYQSTAVVRRGHLTTISFRADKPGIFRIVCHDHLPSMVTQLLVLPKQ